MRIVLFVLMTFLFYATSFGISFVNELTAKQIKKTDSVITVLENNKMVTFKFRWTHFKIIPTGDDTIYAVPPNTIVELIIKDGDEVQVKSSVGVSPGYGQPYFYFEVAKELLDNSTFSVTLYHGRMLSMDRWWFNLKKMYEGLIDR